MLTEENYCTADCIILHTQEGKLMKMELAATPTQLCLTNPSLQFFFFFCINTMVYFLSLLYSQTQTVRHGSCWQQTGHEEANLICRKKQKYIQLLCCVMLLTSTSLLWSLKWEASHVTNFTILLPRTLQRTTTKNACAPQLLIIHGTDTIIL